MARHSTPLPYERLQEHFEWRQSIAKDMPALASRVFALRQSGYMGSGFHYDMERRLGSVMAFSNTYDTIPELHTPIIEKLTYEMLINSIEEAEASAIKREDA